MKYFATSEEFGGFVFLMILVLVSCQNESTSWIANMPEHHNDNSKKNYTVWLSASLLSVEVFCNKTNSYELDIQNEYEADNHKKFCDSNSNKNDDSDVTKTCLMDYPNGKIRDKCQTSGMNEKPDVLLSLPVTSEKNITYNNIVCAVCNCEWRFSVIEKNISFASAEWSKTFDNFPDLCRAKPPSDLENDNFILSVVTWISLIASIICLIFLLIILWLNNDDEFKSITNKSVVSLAVTLLASLLLDGISLRYFHHCTFVIAAMSHYLFISYNFWISIVAQNFWRVIYLKPISWNNARRKIRLNAYLTYCIVGWIIPIFIVGIGLYLDLAPTEEISYSWKPSYGKTKFCFIENKNAMNYLFVVPFLISYVIMFVLFAHTCFVIYSIKRTADVTGITSGQKQYYEFFLKYAILAGLQQTFQVVFLLVDDHSLYQWYHLLISFHGVILFFGYGFHRKSTLRNTLKKLQESLVVRWIGNIAWYLGLRCFEEDVEKDECSAFGEYVVEKLRIFKHDELLKQQVVNNIRTFLIDATQLYLHRKHGSIWIENLQPIAELENQPIGLDNMVVRNSTV